MKKILLFATLTLGVSLLGTAQIKSRFIQLGSNPLNFNRVSAESSNVTGKNASTNALPKSSRTSIMGTLIGFTTYDLQTNASVARRLKQYSGGKMSAVWTFSSGASPFSDRGTAYVHYDGTSWGIAPSVRIESIRTGWPTLASNVAQHELVISHDFSGYLLVQSENTGIGNSSWSQSTPLSASGAVWPRATSVDDNIYVIDNHQDTGFVDPISFVKQPMYFSRSTDGGITYVDDHISLPGYDSTFYATCGPDAYDIDARDNYVAIIAGGFGNDVAVWKSTDYGATFTKTVAWPFAIQAFNDEISDADGDGLADTLDTNDETMNIILDSNADMHAFWGYNRLLNSDGVSSFFFPGSNGLIYWSEVNTTPTVIAGVEDCNQNGTLDIGDLTLDNDLGNQGGQYRLTTMCSMPSAAIDDSGTLYLTYSALNEEDSTANGQNFRDLYVIYSTDFGTTWSLPVNITNGTNNPNPVLEEVFASAGRKVDSDLHLVYMRDDEPGTEVQNGDDPRVNDIVYQKVPVYDIMNPNAGPCSGIATSNGENQQFVKDAFSISNNLPGFDKTIQCNQNGIFSIYNIEGKLVFQQNANKGEKLFFEANSWNSGIYLFVLSGNGQNFTRKVSF
jgi:hypothetical protein